MSWTYEEVKKCWAPKKKRPSAAKAKAKSAIATRSPKHKPPSTARVRAAQLAMARKDLSPRRKRLARFIQKAADPHLFELGAEALIQRTRNVLQARLLARAALRGDRNVRRPPGPGARRVLNF